MFLCNFAFYLQKTENFVNREDIKAPTNDSLRNSQSLNLSEDLLLHHQTTYAKDSNEQF